MMKYIIYLVIMFNLVHSSCISNGNTYEEGKVLNKYICINGSWKSIKNKNKDKKTKSSDKTKGDNK